MKPTPREDLERVLKEYGKTALGLGGAKPTKLERQQATLDFLVTSARALPSLLTDERELREALAACYHLLKVHCSREDALARAILEQAESALRITPSDG